MTDSPPEKEDSQSPLPELNRLGSWSTNGLPTMVIGQKAILIIVIIVDVLYLAGESLVNAHNLCP